MGRNERIEIIREIEERRDSKVITYLTSDRPNANAQMQKDVLPLFVNQIRSIEQQSKIDVFMFTHGGDTITAFGLARLLREYADKIGVLIPDCCHSAGTLFALGANEIHMTKGATLSPIDPSITRPLNPAVQMNPQLPPQLIPLSVESVAGYQALVRKEWCADKTELLKVLAEKVHPLALGDVYRTRQQIEMLATQLLKQHRNDKKNIKKIVNILSKNLGSHDYLIYLSEAKELLGDQIVNNADIDNLIWALHNDYINEMDLGIPYDPNIIINRVPPTGQPVGRNTTVELQLAIIESTGLIDTAKRRIRISERITNLPNGNINRQILQDITFAGWEQSS